MYLLLTHVLSRVNSPNFGAMVYLTRAKNWQFYKCVQLCRQNHINIRFIPAETSIRSSVSLP